MTQREPPAQLHTPPPLSHTTNMLCPCSACTADCQGIAVAYEAECGEHAAATAPQPGCTTCSKVVSRMLLCTLGLFRLSFKVCRCMPWAQPIEHWLYVTHVHPDTHAVNLHHQPSKARAGTHQHRLLHLNTPCRAVRASVW